VTVNWQPSASIENLRKRAQLLTKIRGFFASRDVLEVETPLLCSTSVTAPHIHSIPALLHHHTNQHIHPPLTSRGLTAGSSTFPGSRAFARDDSEVVMHADVGASHYLQTSPEYAMKRLLAAGSGSIYQISKAFRQDESGRFHNPEFTMLEWYRIDFDHHDLMDEMDELLQLVLNTDKAERKSYAEIFQTYLQLDPHAANVEELIACAKQNNLQIEANITDKDTWLQLLMSHLIEPKLGEKVPSFIYDYPASQAALARIQPNNPNVASRFEVYFKGIELANGFHELQNATEQRKRFENDLIERQQLNHPHMPIDEYFLAALSHGLPDCAGVALGIDRLAMLASGCEKIADVVSFDFSRV
jgi:lysyl-tRNA synthetase class 2